MAKVVAIIQARMGSSRFPGKVLADLCGKPVLQWAVDAVRHSCVDAARVSCPKGDKAAVSMAAGCDCVEEVGCDRDVQMRLALTARRGLVWPGDPDIIVRICGDSPLMCPKNIDRCVEALQARGADYCAFQFRDGTPAITTTAGKYPEAFTFRALNELIDQREHVTQPFYRKPWKVAWLPADEEDKTANNTIDTPEDLERLRLQLQSEPAAC